MVLEAVAAAFVATQLCYFVCNCGLLGLFVRRPTNVVDERTLGRVLEAGGSERDRRPPRVQADGGSGPVAIPRSLTDLEHGPGPRCRLPAARLRRIRVLVPVADDRWDALERTLSSIASQSYPTAFVTVYVLYEPRESTALELEGVVDARRPGGLEVVPVAVDREDRPAEGQPSGNRSPSEDRSLNEDRSTSEWRATGTNLSEANAAALLHAIGSQSIADDEVVTVLEPDTHVPVDAFELAVAGLAEYDVVQAKRSVRNADDGIVPLLESMASAAWSDLCHATSSTGPYQLLRTGYFTEARVLEGLDRWRLEAETRPVTLGIAASRRGYTFGVLDRYVREACPTGLGAWVREKRSWVRGPYRHLRARGWAGFDDLRCWTGTILLQALAVVSVVGVPAAIAVALASSSGGAVGTGVTGSTPLRLVVAFNGLVWAYYGLRAYRASWDALPFKSRWHQLGYSIVSNPFTQVLYAILWPVPIGLALVDVVRGG